MRHPSRNVNYNVYETQFQFGKSAPLEQGHVRLLIIGLALALAVPFVPCCMAAVIGKTLVSYRRQTLA